MLRIAVPNKGALSEAASDMLRESGYRQRSSSRELVLADPDNDAEFFFLRPRDIAVYIGSGTLDVGITGRDLLLDSGVDVEEVLPLGFGRSTFRFAGPPGVAKAVGDLAGLRVATSYAGLLERHLADHGVQRHRRPARRCRGVGGGAGRGRRRGRRRRDRLDAAGGRPGGLRRADPAVRGRARAARRRRQPTRRWACCRGGCRAS